MRLKNYPLTRQLDSKDCGPSCLHMIAKYYGKNTSIQYLREKCEINRSGVTLMGISKAAEEIGFRTLSGRISFEQLIEEVSFPCVVHWNQNHFVVIYKGSKNKILVADPKIGIVQYDRKEFLHHWTGNSKDEVGIAMFLEPGQHFPEGANKESDKGINFINLLPHFSKHKKLFYQLGMGFIVGMLLQLMVPAITQSVVDVGIATKDISFIKIILIGQGMLMLGSMVVDFIRSWVLLHISTRINLSLLTEFFIKLLKLPLAYFDEKSIGDIMQRMGDHNRIQSFLTNTVLSFAFSIVTFVVYTIIVVSYDLKLFFIFVAGSLIYLSWILIFLKIRKKLDYEKFSVSSKNQALTIQMIQGAQEIKMSNSEKLKRWEWERVQAKLFKLSMKSLNVNQIQQAGAMFINQSKNIVITFITASSVIEGKLTLGGMIAIQFVLGQLNSPVQQFISFIQSLQDAQISMDRINEIHTLPDEETEERNFVKTLPKEFTIDIKNLFYKYPGYENNYVLQDINVSIPKGKTTAIVGMSGSGKTTLLKLLMKFYEISEGEIRVGGIKLNSFSHSFWREVCGVVMQDGYIFSDTIAKNIAVGEETPNITNIIEAIRMANLTDFIDSLPLGYNTMIGPDGTGLSQGQKQRILIARAVYKDPHYIFFDEATNALDANNERVIVNNLNSFFINKTVVVIAHRLSTVKNADQIIVLREGKIIEIGTHSELLRNKQDYFKLVQNQLDLGN